MAEDIRKINNEVNENTAETQEGAIPDDAAEGAAGGMLDDGGRSGFYKQRVRIDTSKLDRF